MLFYQGSENWLDWVRMSWNESMPVVLPVLWFALPLLNAYLYLGNVQLVLSTARVFAAPRWFYLPRLMPFPHAVLSSDPTALASLPGQVCGVVSGQYKNRVSFFGNMIVNTKCPPPYSLGVIQVTRDIVTRLASTAVLKSLVNLASLQFLVVIFLFTTRHQDRPESLLPTSLQFSDHDVPEVNPVFVFLLYVGLIFLISSVENIENHRAEKHAAPPPSATKKSPGRGNVIIAYPNGSFLVVRCSEEVADELFFDLSFPRFPDESTTRIYIALFYVLAQFLHVLSYIDVRTEFKAGWAGVYAITVYALWILAIISDRISWYSSCFTATQEHILEANERKKLMTTGESWTEALWKTIAISQSTDWVDEIVASPKPTGWQEWISAAGAHTATVQSRTMGGDDGLEFYWKLPIWDAVTQREQRLLGKEPTPRIRRKSRERMPNELSNTLRIWGRPTWLHLLGETLTRRMEKIRRPAVPQGYKRIYWTCSCGDEMYGDYDNVNPAAVDEFASRLQQYNQTSQGTSSAANTGQDPNNTQVSSPNTNSTGIQTLSVSPGPVGAANTVQSSSTAAPSPGTSPLALSTVNQNSTKARRFFELCVNTGELDVRLGEIDVTNTTSDADLFQAIYLRYKGIRGHRMRRIFLKPVNINYVQFSVTERHRVGIYQAPLSIPPEDEIQKGNYHYRECPLQVQPPMDYRTFLHYMHKHKNGDVRNPSGINLTQDATFLERLPKKMKTSILPSSKAEMKFGWGVHIIEGPNKVALSWMTFLALALSFVVSALYAHFWHTQEQGFAIGQWLVAVLTAAMAALYFQWADT